MTGKIFRSVFFAAVGALLACLILILGVLYANIAAMQEAQLKTDLTLAAAGVESGGADYLRALGSNCRLTWIAPDGTVLFDSETDALAMGNHSERVEIKDAFAHGEGKSVRYSDTLTQKTFYRATRLSDGTVLRASLRYATVLTLLLDIAPQILLIFLAAFALSLFLAYKLSAKIVQPLEALDLEHPLSQQTYEELTPLLNKLDAQHREIETQKRELAEKRLNMEFIEQQRREFTANVSHELKTPLQSIMGSAELIEHSIVKAEDLPRFGSNIRTEATRLLALIEDIIHLSRLDEGCCMEAAEVDLCAVCGEQMRALRPLAENCGVELGLTGEHTVITAVPQLVDEIVHNLLENAVKYNKPGGKVTARIIRATDRVLLSVSDTGIGISPEDRERVFERFYRVDKSRTKATGGTGLGLSIVKHAAGHLGAELSLESAVGVGTTVTVKFRG